jgi:hypothetical protein
MVGRTRAFTAFAQHGGALIPASHTRVGQAANNAHVSQRVCCTI